MSTESHKFPLVDLPAHGPNVVGATGGSGTRVVAWVIRKSGMYIGKKLNRSRDAVELAAYSDRWINSFCGDGSAERLREEMTADLVAVLQRHLENRSSRNSAWGWKEPRSIYLLPFFSDFLPSLRFLHFVRDGRDMAFSSNQMQVMKHGDTILPPATRDLSAPERSIALWNQVNVQAADFGERQLRERYLRVRFEDLCAEPEPVISQILDFFGLSGKPARLARRAVHPPRSLGRWRHESPTLVKQLEAIAAQGLERFGYV